MLKSIYSQNTKMVNIFVSNVITRQQQQIKYLKHHIESKHLGLKYSCHQFDLHATKAGNLNLEVQFKSKHEGI